LADLQDAHDESSRGISADDLSNWSRDIVSALDGVATKFHLRFDPKGAKRMRDYVVNVDVRFHVKACSESEAWKICEAKSEQVERLLKDVADDFVAADVWDYTEGASA